MSFALCKTSDNTPLPPPPHLGWGIFLPQGHNLNTHLKGPLSNVTKYRRPWPCTFRQEDFVSVFLNIRVCKTCRPRGGAFLWPQGYNLNNLGRGPLGEAMYQISNPRAFWFQIRRFLKFFPIWVFVKQVTPDAGPFLTPDEATYHESKTWAFWFQTRIFFSVKNLFLAPVT